MTTTAPLTPVSSTNKADHHDITEILLKGALNTINHHKPPQTGNQKFLSNFPNIFSACVSCLYDG
jgi:hypothetical protein